MLRSQAGTRFYAWDDGLGQEENHDAAANRYARDMQWLGRLVGGGLPDGTGNAYVFVKDGAK